MPYSVFCSLNQLSPKGLTHTKHIINMEKGKRPQISIRIAKECQIFFTKELVEKKNTLKNFELNVDRDGI